MLTFATLLVIPFQLQLVGLGVFIFLVWYFILRKYRSLGIRMFFLFSTVAALAISQRIAVLYNPIKEQMYHTMSFNRYKTQQWLLYALPIFFFIIGLILGITCRKYEVGIHEDTGDEYLERDGEIILDEKLSSTARMLKRMNIVSKLVQAFRGISY
ncbi:hypothetical protein GO730_27230 [Spirosoma sp. HMF3257]|uniref:Uncharacterized protein n=1 Tax=Spirosoma telluris TaxID=2183553 RepID=A0A327NR80_9BACT|nr:hypothetical protein [Spirosoma telluris]RAI76939.1 hypothetical protein HMF3257_27155 [Spirosoma telluris]